MLFNSEKKNEKDYQEAIRLCESSTEKDLQKALKLFTKMSDKGHVPSIYSIGMMLLRG